MAKKIKKKILVVFGTRPEAIKMAPLIIELKKRSEFQTKICVTAQHREMLDQVLSVFNILPDFDLNIMKSNQDLFDVTSRVLIGLKDVLSGFKPDIILVHGDTTTSMAAALSGFYAGVKVGHIEAGLRTNNLRSPWPEEANRQITDVVSDYMFAPTSESRNNLLLEGKDANKIFVTGNTVIDALLMTIKDIDSNESNKILLSKSLAHSGYNINRGKKCILITGHRRENFGQGFLNICTAIKYLALKYPEVDFVYPVHLNTNVRKPVTEIISGIGNICLLEPLEYRQFVLLLKHAYLVLTDSGGIQEEAPSVGKPVLVMRETTERPEGINAGTVKLVGTSADNIIESVSVLLDNPVEYKKFFRAHNPYGDGTASKKIVNILLDHL